MFNLIAWLFVGYTFCVIIASIDRDKDDPLIVAWLSGGFLIFAGYIVPVVFVCRLIFEVVDFTPIINAWAFAEDNILRSIRAGAIVPIPKEASDWERGFTGFFMLYAAYGCCLVLISAWFFVKLICDLFFGAPSVRHQPIGRNIDNGKPPP